MQKRLNRSRSCLRGLTDVGLINHALDGGAGPPRRHNVECRARIRGDKTAMLPLAKLFRTLVFFIKYHLQSFTSHTPPANIQMLLNLKHGTDCIRPIRQ